MFSNKWLFCSISNLSELRKEKNFWKCFTNKHFSSFHGGDGLIKFYLRTKFRKFYSGVSLYYQHSIEQIFLRTHPVADCILVAILIDTGFNTQTLNNIFLQTKFETVFFFLINDLIKNFLPGDEKSKNTRWRFPLKRQNCQAILLKTGSRWNKVGLRCIFDDILCAECRWNFVPAWIW